MTVRRLAAGCVAAVVLCFGAVACVAPPPQNPCVAQIEVWFGANPAVERHMERIAWRESRWEPNPKPWRNSLGCLQVSWSAHEAELRRLGVTRDMLGDPAVNVAYARLLYQREGDHPWLATR